MVAVTTLVWAAVSLGGAAPGVFDGAADVGPVRHPGRVTFDPQAGAYTVTGSGDGDGVALEMAPEIFRSAAARLLAGAFTAPGNSLRKRSTL